MLIAAGNSRSSQRAFLLRTRRRHLQVAAGGRLCVELGALSQTRQAGASPLVASCLRGALPPVDFLAVCFVRAMVCGGQVAGL